MDNPKDTLEGPIVKPKKKRGRPRKTENKRPVGRPRNEHKHAMQEFLGSIINRPDSKEVINTVFRHALNDDSPKQTAAWTLILDRIAPKSLAEAEVSKGQVKNAIQINITGVGQSNTDVESNTIDADFEEVNNNDV